MLRRTFQFLYEIITAERKPHQIALGIALGVVIGILPKANLIAVLFLVLLFALRTNLGAGLVTAAICSWIGTGFDPMFDRIGQGLLSVESLQGFYAWIYQLPYAPWTSFNNSVVLGALVVGLLQLAPTYLWCRRIFGHTAEAPLAAPLAASFTAPVDAGISVVPSPKFSHGRKNRRYLISADTPQ